MQQKDKTHIYSTILVIVSGLLVVHLIWGKKIGDFPWLVVIAAVVGIISLLSTQVAQYIVLGWEKLAQALGYINSRILLSIIFFLLLFPLALIYRIFSKDPLQLKKPVKTNFKTRNHTFGPGDLEKMW